MKKILIVLSCFGIFLGHSQTLNPVKWEAKFVASSNNEGEIVLTAKIDKNWHIYSQRPAEDGPIPTSFIFDPQKNFELIGSTQEKDAREEYVKAFETKVWLFDNEAVFKQKIKLINSNNSKTIVKLEYMACNDIQCLPPKTIEIQIAIPGKK